jgi:hypothetical protein
MLLLISRAGNGPEAMENRQCDHRDKQYWKEYPEAKKSGNNLSGKSSNLAGCSTIDVIIFVDSVCDC